MINQIPRVPTAQPNDPVRQPRPPSAARGPNRRDTAAHPNHTRTDEVRQVSPVSSFPALCKPPSPTDHSPCLAFLQNRQIHHTRALCTGRSQRSGTPTPASSPHAAHMYLDLPPHVDAMSRIVQIACWDLCKRMTWKYCSILSILRLNECRLGWGCFCFLKVINLFLTPHSNLSRSGRKWRR